MNRYKYVKTDQNPISSHTSLSKLSKTSSITQDPESNFQNCKYIKQSAFTRLKRFQHSSFNTSHSQYLNSKNTHSKINNIVSTNTIFNNKYIKAIGFVPNISKSTLTSNYIRSYSAKYINHSKTHKDSAVSECTLWDLKNGFPMFKRTNQVRNIAQYHYKFSKRKFRTSGLKPSGLNINKYKLSNNGKNINNDMSQTSSIHESFLNNKYIKYSRGAVAGTNSNKQQIARYFVNFTNFFNVFLRLKLKKILKKTCV